MGNNSPQAATAGTGIITSSTTTTTTSQQNNKQNNNNNDKYQHHHRDPFDSDIQNNLNNPFQFESPIPSSFLKANTSINNKQSFSNTLNSSKHKQQQQQQQQRHTPKLEISIKR
jgi:lipopolysaccharide export LptBFGC system permease protein LptF